MMVYVTMCADGHTEIWELDSPPKYDDGDWIHTGSGSSQQAGSVCKTALRRLGLDCGQCKEVRIVDVATPTNYELSPYEQEWSVLMVDGAGLRSDSIHPEDIRERVGINCRGLNIVHGEVGSLGKRVLELEARMHRFVAS